MNVKLRLHTPQSASWEERWRQACTETFQPCDLITIQKQRWEDEHCCVPSAAHPQLQDMMCMNGRVAGWATASPNLPPDPHLPTTHFLQGDRQPLLSVRVSSTTDPWGISLGGNLQSNDAPPSYTCGGKQDLRTALLLILCCPFPCFLCCLSYAHFPFSSSSLSSA